MNRKLTVHSEAEAEILQALTWYGERSRVAARAFVQELTSMVTLATRSPESWPRSYGNTRQIVFPRFLKLLITDLDMHEALGEINVAIDCLYDHSDFRSISREMFGTAIAGKLTTDKEAVLRHLGIKI
jgi:hypothetical protein